MSLAIDAIILIGAILIIWNGARRGFIRSVMSFASGITAFVAAYAYTPMLAEHVKEKFLVGNIADSIESTLGSLADPQKTGSFNLDKLAFDTPKALTDILDRYNIEADSFIAKFFGLTNCEGDVVRGFAEDIATPTANIIANALSFIVIFFGMLIILALLTALLDLIFKMPALKKANTFLGFVFGTCEGILYAFVSAAVLSVLVSALGSIDPTLFGSAAVEQTMICKWLIEHNPLGVIISFFA